MGTRVNARSTYLINASRIAYYLEIVQLLFILRGETTNVLAGLAAPPTTPSFSGFTCVLGSVAGLKYDGG